MIAGSVTGDLTPTAIGGGADSFVAKYDSAGNQTWLRQVSPAMNDQANSVSVDQAGNIYVGGQVNGANAAGALGRYIDCQCGRLCHQTRQHGQADLSAEVRQRRSRFRVADGHRGGRQSDRRQPAERPCHSFEICRHRRHQRSHLANRSRRSEGRHHRRDDGCERSGLCLGHNLKCRA